MKRWRKRSLVRLASCKVGDAAVSIYFFTYIFSQLESLPFRANPPRYMNQPSFLWLNGHIVAAHEARLSPLDHGLLVGDGVFETMAVRTGKVIASQAHYERLQRSCQTMGLACISAAEFSESIQAVLEANGMRDARVRVTLTSGEGPLGSDRGHGVGTFMTVATPLKPWPPTEAVSVVPWVRCTRSALAGVKSVSYGDNVRCLLEAKKRGCGEALLFNERDELCEGTGSNVFVVFEGRLMTPPLESGCLAGVTRGLVLEACQSTQIVCEEKAITRAMLERCEEAFLTSSTRDVHPIDRIDHRRLPTPGALTAKVKEAYIQVIV